VIIVYTSMNEMHW